MTKRDFIQKRVQRLVQLSALISVPAIGIMIYAQMTDHDSRPFWVAMFALLGVCSVGMLVVFWIRLRCPDCGHNLCSQYFRELAVKAGGNGMVKCRGCQTDLCAEMKAR